MLGKPSGSSSPELWRWFLSRVAANQPADAKLKENLERRNRFPRVDLGNTCAPVLEEDRRFADPAADALAPVENFFLKRIAT